MRHLRLTSLVVLALFCATSSLSAQRRTGSSSSARPSLWEPGLDGAFSLGLDDPQTTTLDVPVSSLRAGIYTSDVIEIEPFFMLRYAKVEGFDAGTLYQFGSGLLYHFSADRSKSQLYVRPMLFIQGASGGGTSNSDLGGGIGVGMKWPMKNTRFAWRGEANVAAVNDRTAISLMWGLSYFNR